MKFDFEDWPTTRREFSRIAACEGVEKIAEEVPADRATIYRLIGGETHVPSRAVRAGIERIVQDRQKHQKQP